MTHLKRYHMPGFWALSVKKETFVVHPRGAHPQAWCIPLRVVLRDILGIAHTNAEVKKLLQEGKILIDKKARKDGSLGVGLMDILDIPEIKKTYRAEAGKRGLVITEHPETSEKTCKIINKTTVRGGKDQIHLHDGRNVFVEKKSPYKPGDSVTISLPDQKITSHLPLKKGSHVMILEGKNKGARGTVTTVLERKYMLETPTVTIESDGKRIETLKHYLFVIGDKEKK